MAFYICLVDDLYISENHILVLGFYHPVSEINARGAVAVTLIEILVAVAAAKVLRLESPVLVCGHPMRGRFALAS